MDCPAELIKVVKGLSSAFFELSRYTKAVRCFPDITFDLAGEVVQQLRSANCEELADLLEKTAEELQVAVIRLRGNFSVTKTDKLENGNYILSVLINDKWLRINREFKAIELGINEVKG